MVIDILEKIERGDKMLSIHSLVRMAEALHVSADALIYESAVNNAKKNIAQMLVSVDEKNSRQLFDLLQYVNDNFLK